MPGESMNRGVAPGFWLVSDLRLTWAGTGGDDDDAHG
jgi:hypothetical protein